MYTKKKILKAEFGLGDPIPDMGGGRSDMGTTDNPKQKRPFMKDLLNSFAAAGYIMPGGTTEDPSSFLDTVKGGLSGAAAGPLGIIGGAALGLIKGTRDEEIHDETQKMDFINKLRSSSFNIDRGSFIPSLKKGGGIPKYDDGGEMPNPEQQGIFIQAQKGETKISPDGSLYDVKATQLHKEMKKDKITDYIEPGEYTFSDTLTLKKDQADKVILARFAPVYSDDTPLDYDQVTLGDLFTKDEHTFADLSKKVVDMFPLMDNKQDAFAISANTQNKNSRLSFFAALVQANEAKKNKQGKAIPAQASQTGQDPDQDKDLNQDADQDGDGLPHADGGLGFPKKFKPGNYLDVLTPDDSTYDERWKAQYPIPISGNVPYDDSSEYAGFSRPPILKSTYDNPFEDSSVFGISKNQPNVLDGYQSNLSTLRSPEETQIQLNRRGDIYNGELLPQGKISGVNSLNPAIPGTIGGPGTSTVGIRNDPSNPNSSKGKFGDYITSLKDKINAQNQRNEQEYQNRLIDSDKAYGTSKNYLGLSTLAALTGSLLQDPTVKAPNLNQSYIDAMPQEIPQDSLDYSASKINTGFRPFVRAAFENSSNFSQAQSALSGLPAKIANAQSDLAAGNQRENIQLKTNFLANKNAIVNGQEKLNTDSMNRTSTNANKQIADIAGTGVNYFNNRSKLFSEYKTYNDKLKAQRNSSTNEANNTLTGLEILNQF